MSTNQQLSEGTSHKDAVSMQVVDALWAVLPAAQTTTSSRLKQHRLNSTLTLPIVIDRDIILFYVKFETTSKSPVYIHVHASRNMPLQVGDVPLLVSNALRAEARQGDGDEYARNCEVGNWRPTQTHCDFNMLTILQGSQVVVSSTPGYFTPIPKHT